MAVPQRIAAVAVLLLSCTASDGPAEDRCPAAHPHKLRICHSGDGLQPFKPIEVAEKAYDAHAEHGDSLAGTARLDCDCQPDYDADLIPDLLDPCPAEPGNQCDPEGSTAKTVDAMGATLATPDGTTTMIIPPQALLTTTSASITDTDAGGTFEIATTDGEVLGVLGFEIVPEGLTFEVPVTIVLQWEDEDDDGFIDHTTANERELFVLKDGAPLTDSCENDPGCDRVANTFLVVVEGLSSFVAGVPLDSDDDGVPDHFRGERDNCPTTPNPDQQNSDSDTHGDACDNCAIAANQDQADNDSDGIGNACDICPDGNNLQACDDSNACTTGDVCTGGAGGECLGEDTSQTDCDDSNECTADSCEPATGCVNLSEPEGAACGDDSVTACTGPDTCDGFGTCEANHVVSGAPCGDLGTECVVQDTCNGSGICTDNGFVVAETACGDLSDTACTDPDTCDGAGACQANDLMPTACVGGDCFPNGVAAGDVDQS
jgi:hypothetical protein